MRNFRIFTLFLMTGIFSFSIFSNVYAQKNLKRRIAVFDFEDKTDHRLRWYKADQPVGHGMADMLVTALVKSGEYVVIERQAIKKIIQEQKLGLSGMVTPQTAVQVGKLLGVELAIIGSVTEFGYSSSETKGSFGGIGGGVKTTESSVGIDVRFINTTTGEILAADNVRKQESSSGISFSNSELNVSNKKDFDDSIVGKATRDAIESIVELIGDQMGSLPWSAKVIMEKGGVVYINAGSQSGVSTGTQFEVYREGESLIDPDTGLDLGSTEEKIGRIEVFEDVAGGKASKAKILTGSGFQKGDVVRDK